MSINAIINNSLTGLFTNQAALRATSNNIANVNTPGYARQVVRQESILAGSQSAGVKISGIDRVVDKFLVSASRTARSDFHRYDIERSFQERVQALLGRPDENNSLPGRIDQVFTAFAEVALNPLSSILKESVLSSIDQFGGEIGALGTSVQNLRLDASNQIAEQINTVNALLQRIGNLNPLITKETITGGTPGSLLEQRAQAIDQLSTFIDISVTDTGYNGVQVGTSSGIILVGQVRSELRYTPPGTVTSSTPFSPIIIHQVDPVSGDILPSTTPLDNDLLSGSIYGLLNLRDRELPEVAEELGNMASSFVDEINRIHNLNTAAPPANSFTGKNIGLVATDAHNFTGESVFAITDASGSLVDKVTIDFGAIGATVNDVLVAVNAALGGTGTLALSNGVMSFTATNATHGVSISQVDGNESARAGRGFSHFFGLNDLAVSRVPAHFETGVTGTESHGFTPGGTIHLELTNPAGIEVSEYTMTISGTSYNDLLTDLNASSLGTFVTFSLSPEGELVSTTNPNFPDMSVRVKSDSTARGTTGHTFSSFFGVGPKYKIDAAFELGARPEFKANAGLLSLGRFDQTVAIGENAISVGDQSGALAFQDMENTTFTFRQAGGLSAITSTLGQYGASILSDLGLRTQLTTGFAKDSEALLGELEQRSSNISGVNLDEELGNMIIYQNAYSASARLLATAQELFDSLLAVV